MAKSKAKILVVDDNSGIRAALKVLLPLHFSQVELIPSPKELVTKMADFRPDVVLLDMNFHTDINTGNEGLFWLSEIKKRTPETEEKAIRAAMTRFGGNLSMVAKSLEISRPTLYAKLKKYNI